MPQQKYEPIYQEIKREIETGVYKAGDFLPSENTYTEKYNCTRNTIRRALSMLTSDGYLLPQHGRGVQVIYSPKDLRSLFSIGGIESLGEAAKRNQIVITTKVITFKEMVADESISMMAGFDIGEEVYFIERVRKTGKKAIIFDTNVFLKSETKGLTKEIAEKSVYDYLELELGMTITTSRRRITAQQATKKDLKYLSLGSLDFVLTVEGQVFNSRGVMFEYTQSRHVPDQVCFIESAVRQRAK